MSQTSALVATLKQALRAHGFNYRKVAAALDLSEASIKRLFAEESFSVERLEQICRLLGMEIADLVHEMEARAHRISELTEAQEQELVSDERLLMVAFVILNGWKYEDILERFRLAEAETVRFLARLDRLKFIELLPGNRFRLLVSRQFAWRRNGPIQRYFTANLLRDFLDSPFEREDEWFTFLSGMLSRSSNSVLLKKLERLAADFADLNREDQPLPYAERFGYSLVMALRPWRPDAFDRLSR
jgi:hypothetical protein